MREDIIQHALLGKRKGALKQIHNNTRAEHDIVLIKKETWFGAYRGRL